jgi:hypothetical protein
MLTSAEIGKQNGDTRTRKPGYLNLSIDKYRDFVGISLDSTIVDGSNYRVKIYIPLLDLTRNSCENATICPSDMKRTCGPAISVQRSNQLNDRSQLSITTSSCMYIQLFQLKLRLSTSKAEMSNTSAKGSWESLKNY